MRSSRPISFCFLLIGILLFGCSATAAPSDPATPAGPTLAKPDAEGRVTLAVAGGAEVATGIALTFERVVADSRCPVDVNCVWAGEIRVALKLASPQTGAPPLELELSTREPIATARGIEVELLGALPAPNSKRAIAAADYLITLRVTPAPKAAD
jgi:hypothetical protein